MIKTALITTAILATGATAGVGTQTSSLPVPQSLTAQIACFEVSLDADGGSIALSAGTDLNIDIAFTGDRHIRIGA